MLSQIPILGMSTGSKMWLVEINVDQCLIWLLFAGKIWGANSTYYTWHSVSDDSLQASKLSRAVRQETHMTTVRQSRVKLDTGKARTVPGLLTRARKDSVSACRLWIWQEVLCNSTLRAAASFSSWVWALRASSACCCGESGVSRGAMAWTRRSLSPSWKQPFDLNHFFFNRYPHELAFQHLINLNI